MMKKFITNSIMCSVSAMILIGCGTTVKNKTPEEAYESFIHLQAEGTIDKEISMVSKSSLKEQGLDESIVKQKYEEIFKNLKFNDYKVIGINVVKSIPIDDKNMILETQVKYTTNEKNEPQTLHEVVVFKLEDGVWNISPNGYIRTYQFKNKCAENGGIKICLAAARQFADEIDVEANIENTNPNTYAFGFAQPSGIAMLFGKKEVVEGTHPRLQDMRAGNSIPTGKSKTVFIFGDGTQIFTPKNTPKAFVVDKIISMNGSLPSGFGEGLTIKIGLD